MQFILKHEKGQDLRFAPLQGSTFSLKLAGKKSSLPDSIVFAINGQLLAQAEAVIAISAWLKQPWRFLGSLGSLLPTFLADGLYRFIARNRYRWFGKREACYLPTPELKQRFLD